MGATDRFSPENVQRILGLTARQLDYWDRLRLVSPKKEQENRFYDFRDLIGLRTVKQLIEEGVPANRLRRALAALRAKLVQVQAPLTELRILSDGKDMIVERHGARLEPQADKKTRTEAIDAYDRALRVDPAKIDALLNCGTLHYENGSFEKASEYFGREISLEPDSELAHFNLGSVLEEVGDLDAARKHLRQAVRLDPNYPDSQYNLAYVCEKLGAFAEAREHWRAYLMLDPVGPWSNYARQKLSSSMQVKSAGNI